MGTISGCIEGIITEREERKLRLRMVQEGKGKGHGKQVKKKKAPRSRWFAVNFRQQFKFLSFENGNNTYLSPRGRLVIHVEKCSEILGRKVCLEM